MDEQKEWGFRTFEEAMKLSRKQYEEMSDEERRQHHDDLNRATDCVNDAFIEAMFGLCPDCKAREESR